MIMIHDVRRACFDAKIQRDVYIELLINLNTEISEANAKWVKMAQDAQALLEKTVTQRTLELHEAKVQAEQANEARGH